MKQLKGFTLLEMLLVVAAIGILAAIVIIAINPNRQLAQTRDAERRSEMNAVFKAIEQYQIENAEYPSELESLAVDSQIEICAQNALDCSGKLDLTTDLSPSFVAEIPSEPNPTDENSTGYYVSKSASGRIIVFTPNGEIEETIVINGTLDDIASVSFQYWRFVPTRLRDFEAASAVQLSELQLFNNDTLLTPDSVSNPGGSSLAGEGPEQAIDNDLNTKWVDDNRLYLELNFTEPVTVTEYNWATANDHTERDPLRWKLQARNELTDDWTTVDDRSLADQNVPLARDTWTAAGNSQLLGYEAAGPLLVEEGYRFWRLRPTAFRGAGSEIAVQISELQFSIGDTYLPAMEAINPGGDNPSGEDAEMINDNDVNTKWLDFNQQSIVFDFRVRVNFDEYNWATANDEDDRDPIRWAIEGADSIGGPWTSIDDRTGSDQSVTTNRFEWVAPGALRETGFSL